MFRFDLSTLTQLLRRPGTEPVALDDANDPFLKLLDDGAVLVPVIDSFDKFDDAVVCVYQKGTRAPKLDLTPNQDGTRTLSADDEPVALVTCGHLRLSDIKMIPAEDAREARQFDRMAGRFGALHFGFTGPRTTPAVSP